MALKTYNMGDLRKMQMRQMQPQLTQLSQQKQMAAGGFTGNGTKVGYATGSPHTWLKLEQVLDVQPSKFTASEIDTTVHGSTGFISKISGLFSVTDTVVQMLRDDSASTAPNQNSLFALAIAKTTVWLRIEIPDGPDFTTASWEAYEYQVKCKSWEPVAPINDKQVVQVTFLFCGTSFTRYPPTTSALG